VLLLAEIIAAAAAAAAAAALTVATLVKASSRAVVAAMARVVPPHRTTHAPQHLPFQASRPKSQVPQIITFFPRKTTTRFFFQSRKYLTKFS
jgi:hypothetical protein